jgi:hypothetical protein
MPVGDAGVQGALQLTYNMPVVLHSCFSGNTSVVCCVAVWRMRRTRVQQGLVERQQVVICYPAFSMLPVLLFFSGCDSNEFPPTPSPFAAQAPQLCWGDFSREFLVSGWLVL